MVACARGRASDTFASILPKAVRFAEKQQEPHTVLTRALHGAEPPDLSRLGAVRGEKPCRYPITR